MKTLTERNRLLTESAGPISETMMLKVDEITVVSTNEAKEGAKYRAKVSQADIPNGNRRIYPREVLAVALERCKQRIKEGKLTGACDHPGWDGGLKDTCIVWDSLTMDQSGAVFGDFRIIAKSNHGEHLMALRDAGVALGFSTRGYGSAHYPSDDEKKRYGLDDDCDIVIIDDNFNLRKIDSVDDPSVEDAYAESDPPASQSGKKQDSRESDPLETLTMKTLAEVQAQNSALWNEIQSAQAAAVAAATKPLNEKIVELTNISESHKKVIDGANLFVASLKDIKGVTLPERQVATPEDKAKLEQVGAQVKDLTTKLETANGQVKTLEQQIAADKAARDAEAARAERVSKATAKLAENLENNPFAEEITAIATEEKVMDRADFDEAAVPGFVKLHSDRFAKIAAKSNKQSAWLGVTGNPSGSGESAKRGEGIVGEIANGL